MKAIIVIIVFIIVLVFVFMSKSTEHLRSVGLYRDKSKTIRGGSKSNTLPQHLMITGIARSGKTSACSYIVSEYGYEQHDIGGNIKPFTLTALNAVRALDNKSPLPISVLIDAETKEQYRPLMNVIGTSCCRHYFGDDIWCKALVRQLKNVSGRWIIGDIRLPAEVEYIKSVFKDAKIIKIERPYLTTEVDATHVTEASIKDIVADYTIINESRVNDGDLTHLHNKVRELFASF